MVNVKSKTCIHPNCKTRPYFNVEGETTGLYCSKHKSENMIDIKHQRCLHPNCKKQPNFNVEGEKVPKYCSKHKSENMVNIFSNLCSEQYLGTFSPFTLKTGLVLQFK